MADITSVTNLIMQVFAGKVSVENTKVDSDLKGKFEDLLKNLTGDENSSDFEEIGLDCFKKTPNAESKNKKPNSLQANKLMSYFDINGDRVLNNEEIDGLKEKMGSARRAIGYSKEYNNETGEKEYKPLDIDKAVEWACGCGGFTMYASDEVKEFLKKYDADGDGILSPEEQVSMERDMDEVDKILEDNVNVHGTKGRDEYNNIEIGETGEKAKPAKIGSLEFIKNNYDTPLGITGVEYDNQGRVIAFSTVDCEVAIGGETNTKYDVVYNDDGTCTVTSRCGVETRPTSISKTYDKDGNCIECKEYDRFGNEIIIPNEINTDNTKE